MSIINDKQHIFICDGCDKKVPSIHREQIHRRGDLGICIDCIPLYYTNISDDIIDDQVVSAKVFAENNGIYVVNVYKEAVLKIKEDKREADIKIKQDKKSIKTNFVKGDKVSFEITKNSKIVFYGYIIQKVNNFSDIAFSIYLTDESYKKLRETGSHLGYNLGLIASEREDSVLYKELQNGINICNSLDLSVKYEECRMKDVSPELIIEKVGSRQEELKEKQMTKKEINHLIEEMALNVEVQKLFCMPLTSEEPFCFDIDFINDIFDDIPEEYQQYFNPDNGALYSDALVNKISSFIMQNLYKKNFTEVNLPATFLEPKNNNSSNKEIKMSNSEQFVNMMKKDLTMAGYRVAATQMTKGAKAGLLLALADHKLESDKIEAISNLLESEAGTAIISLVLGMLLTYIPNLKNDPRVEKLAEEFRVNGVVVVGNQVIEKAGKYVMPAINSAISLLPDLTAEEKKKMRIKEVEENSSLSLVDKVVQDNLKEEEEPLPIPKKNKASKAV